MGLAVIPGGLDGELQDLAAAKVELKDLEADPVLSKHAPLVAELNEKYTFTAENALDLLLQETGRVFSQVLEDAGVYKNTPDGLQDFLKFVDTVNQG